MPGSLAWIAATHGGERPDPIARASAALASSDSREGRARDDDDAGSAQPGSAKAERRAAARQERAERRAAAKEAKRRAREERARAKQEAAAERERERTWAEESKRLADEKAAAEKAEQESARRRADEAAQERTRRREESKAAARAALAARPGARRAESSSTVPEQAPSEAPGPDADETAVLEAVGADTTAPPATDADDTPRAAGPDEASSDAEPPEKEPSGTEPSDTEPSDTEQTVVVAPGATDVERTTVLARAVDTSDTAPEEAPGSDRRRARAEARSRTKAEAVVERKARRGRSAETARHRDDVPEPPSVPSESRGGAARVLGLVGVAVGVVGLTASVLLALAALLVAFGFDADSGVLRSVGAVADPLTSPLRGIVTFTGENAAAKESFVAYGAGSVVYLVLGFAAPTLLNRRAKDGADA